MNSQRSRARLVPLSLLAMLLLAGTSADAHRGSKHAKKKPAVAPAPKRADATAPGAQAPVAVGASAGDGAHAEPVAAKPSASTVVAKPAAEHNGGHDEGGIKTLIGKLHPLLVHMPIGWLLMVLLLEFGGIVFRRPRWADLAPTVLMLALASFVPAILSGLIRNSDHAARDVNAALLHRNLMLGVTALTGVAFAISSWRGEAIGGGRRVAYLVILAAAGILLAVAGHIGAELVYGADYLPF